MATTSDVRTFARALFETLIGTALDQLRQATPKLAGISDSDPGVQQKIAAALSAKTMPEVQNFLMVLAREGALDQLPEIVKAFESYVETGDRVLDAEVISAVPLSQAQQDRIVKDLRGRYQAQLHVTFTVDESLIGGLIIRVGDEVLDNSLRARLSSVQRNMLSS